MGNIYTACNNFSKLLNKECNIILGRKGKEFKIKIRFSEYEFFHLSGLHKLTDIENLSYPNSKNIFNDILKGKISQELCRSSDFYNKIDGRIYLIENLEIFLDSNKTVFKYNNRAKQFSYIEADFLLKNSNEQDNMYVYISRNENESDTYFCRSAFPRSKLQSDYALGHTLYAMLYKEKVNLLSGEKKILYVHPKYEEQCIHH
ncbi:MAG: PBECR4 domain-containing protein [Ruminococcus sp.]|nr:PBECR4 domain-containing protein [Ruminococcus sp.]